MFRTASRSARIALTSSPSGPLWRRMAPLLLMSGYADATIIKEMNKLTAGSAYAVPLPCVYLIATAAMMTPILLSASQATWMTTPSIPRSRW